MYVVVVVMLVFAGGANGVFGLKLFVRNPVQNAGVQKLLQAPVNGGPVDLSLKPRFQIGVRQGMRICQKRFQDVDSLCGIPEIEIPK